MWLVPPSASPGNLLQVNVLQASSDASTALKRSGSASDDSDNRIVRDRWDTSTVSGEWDCRCHGQGEPRANTGGSFFLFVWKSALLGV